MLEILKEDGIFGTVLPRKLENISLNAFVQ
jgi:hypothetical protein